MNMPKVLDPEGDNGELVDPRNQQSLRCRLCGKEMNSEISCLEYHLAKIIGHEMEILTKSSILPLNQFLILERRKMRESKTCS